ncbi:aldose epimerase family protein [Arcticibacterium luteifluviistationis]|uniref:Aldose 1-epimerase n=1 Tax=Arcticibacterium luteifluviistationis TaxID=1784714 RepID=A0A2Z4G6I2_9BACT|nr:aldose epimerase family protein [Arcticibacterium luteifluviistationis]AWV96730.1 galactose-1-epimerase [Arcticibacterium luteifluviistationis]
MVKNVFGTLKGVEVHVFTLKNANGMEVKISNYGATITSITVPTHDGRDELVAGFDTLGGYFSEEYKANAPYFGCTVGRVASIIKDSSFTLNGEKHKLKANAGSDQLHGGPDSFDKKLWKVGEVENGIEMNLFSPDGENGFPGNLNIKVTFQLSNENALLINYEGETDQDTPISLTNHSYFNLNGFKETIANHTAMIKASHALETDADFAPIGKMKSLEKDITDLRQVTRFAEVFEKSDTGILQYYIFDDKSNKLESIASFEDMSSGRKLEVLTTEPGMLLYSGFFTSDNLKREDGLQYGSLRAFCCETSRCPNGVNEDKLPGTFTKAGEKYTSQTVYKFTF